MNKMLIDARATQEGYKQHKRRGIGKYVQNLLVYLPSLTNDIEFTYLLDPSKPIDAAIANLPVRFLYHATVDFHFYEMQYLATQLFLSKTLSKEEFNLTHFATQDDAAFFPTGRFCVTILDTITTSMKQLYRPGTTTEASVFALMVKTDCATVVSRLDNLRAFEKRYCCSPWGKSRAHLRNTSWR